MYEEQRTVLHPADSDVEMPPGKVAIVEVPEGDRASQRLSLTLAVGDGVSQLRALR